MAKKAKLSPTKLALDECARRGWIAEKVEQRLPRCFITKDFLGCIDILALTDTSFLGIQVTSRSNHAARRTKALLEPRLRRWWKLGGRFAVWSYDTDPAKGIVFREEEILDPSERAADHRAGHDGDPVGHAVADQLDLGRT